MKPIDFLIEVYYKLPFRPFRKQLASIYNKYTQKEEGKIVQAKRKGINFELDLNERVQANIYHGFFEPSVTKEFERILKEGGVVIDIGSNIGYYTLLSAKLVGNSGRVYAFEPMSFAYNKLLKNLSLNNFNNIHLEKKGVSNRKESKSINFENEYVLRDIKPHEESLKKESVEFIRLDDFVKENNLAKLDLLKIDTDGYDSKVLEGSIETIKKFNPKLITCEISPDDDIKKYLDIVFSLGYKVRADAGGSSRDYSREEIENLIKNRGIITLILKRN